MKTSSEKDMIESTQNLYGTALEKLGAALNVFTEGTGNPTIPIQQVRMFLHVATHGEVLQADLAEVSGTAQSSVSRNLSLLADGLYGETGYGLLTAHEVQHYRRSNVVQLTEKGKALAWDMQQAFAEHPVPRSHNATREAGAPR